METINPKSYLNWKEALDTNVNYFILEEGDYTNWDSFEPHKPTVIRSNQVTHPYFEPKVIIKKFELRGVDYCTVQGINIKENNVIQNSNHNLIDKCFIQGQPIAIRVMNSSFNTIQACVFKGQGGNDGGAIGLGASKFKSSSSNRIIGNEIINYNDGIGFVRESSQDMSEGAILGDCRGTLIQDNDIYITSELYRTEGDQVLACAENGIDIKSGGTKELPIRILDNRLWGFRESDQSCGPSGSIGPAITIHRDASHILIEGNVIFDSNIGIYVLGQDDKFPLEQIENITVLKNTIYNIRKFSDNPYSGSALLLATGIEARNNRISLCKYGIFILKKIQGNIKKNVFYLVDQQSKEGDNKWKDAGKWFVFYNKKITNSSKIFVSI